MSFGAVNAFEQDVPIGAAETQAPSDLLLVPGDCRGHAHRESWGTLAPTEGPHNVVRAGRVLVCRVRLRFLPVWHTRSRHGGTQRAPSSIGGRASGEGRLSVFGLEDRDE